MSHDSKYLLHALTFLLNSIGREFGRLTTDVISSCGFGIDAGCIRDEKSKFYVESKEAFDRFETPPLRLKITTPLYCEYLVSWCFLCLTFTVFSWLLHF